MNVLKAFFITSMLLVGPSAKAQQSYTTTDGVAVFIPEGFDASQHLPSPIFVRELVPQGNLPQDWQLRPQFTTENGKSIAAIHVGDDVDLYGTGEVFGHLRRNGETEGFWNKDNGAYAAEGGRRLYQTHPWVLGVRKDGTAFGIIGDNTWKSRLTTDSTIRFESDGPAFRVVIIEKESPQEVLKTLAQLSGTMQLPPLWSLGYQQCRFSYHPDTRVKEIADTLRLKQIPCDVIWMDIHYMDEYRIFTFNKREFPNPKDVNNYLHSKNLKSVYMIDPGVKADPNYFVDKVGTERDYWVKDKDGNVFEGNVWPGKCHFPDFTRPEVRQWWGTLYKDFMAQGVDGVWNDMNEPSVFDGPDGSMPEDNVHHGGDGLAPGPHLRYHNQYGFNMVRASRDGILQANPDKRPFVLSRSNFLGGQRYAATWTGDNWSSYEHMRLSIPMTLNMSLTGQCFNGPDIGGFLNNCTPDLLAHWTATGVYFPFVRNHSCDGTVNQEPWAMGKETEDACRTAINRRYRLLPYIYTLFREASESGMPIMRPVFFADTRDASLRGEDQAFMLGQDLLIIPRWAKNPQLPKGDWDLISFENEQADNYQAYVALRPGAIVPMANLCQSTEELSTDSLTLLVNPAADGTAIGWLYEDSGNGFDYQKGDYAMYRLKAETTGKKITVSMTKEEGARAATPSPNHPSPSGRLGGVGATLRIGIVSDGRVIYSPWTKGDSVTMKAIIDRSPTLDISKLNFTDLKE